MKEKCYVVEPSKVIIIKHDDGNRAYGNTVYVKGFTSNQVLMFAHLSKINVIEGQILKEHDIVGEIGDSGYSPLGAHLHCSLFPVGANAYFARHTIDPASYFEKFGYPCRTVITNLYGSNYFNDNIKDKDGGNKLNSHEGIDFSSHRLRPEFT